MKILKLLHSYKAITSKIKQLLALFNYRAFDLEKRLVLYRRIILGFSLTILLHIINLTGWVQDFTNIGLDSMISYEAKRAAKKEVMTDLFFLDINYEDFKRWNEPLITPRENIARLIEFSEKNGARVIVLDISLEKPDCCNSHGDAELRIVLEKMLKQNSSTKIIFPIRIDYEGNLHGTIFDDLVARQRSDVSKLFYYALPDVYLNKSDLRVRYTNIHPSYLYERYH